jgi:hypothetical protein
MLLAGKGYIIARGAVRRGEGCTKSLGSRHWVVKFRVSGYVIGSQNGNANEQGNTERDHGRWFGKINAVLS